MEMLDRISTWQDIERLEFLIADGEDSMMGLQVKLDRKTFPLTKKPSELCESLENQTIYSFCSL